MTEQLSTHTRDIQYSDVKIENVRNHCHSKTDFFLNQGFKLCILHITDSL